MFRPLVAEYSGELRNHPELPTAVIPLAKRKARGWTASTTSWMAHTMQRRCGSEQLEHAPVIDINPRLDAQSKANLKLEVPP